MLYAGTTPASVPIVILPGMTKTVLLIRRSKVRTLHGPLAAYAGKNHPASASESGSQNRNVSPVVSPVATFIALAALLLTVPGTAEAHHPFSKYERWAKARCVQNTNGHHTFCKTIVKATRRVKGVRAGWAARPGLAKLVRAESSYNARAVNRSSGACGWFQFLPCRCYHRKIRQAVCGLRYIRGRYGHPRTAWLFHTRRGWY